MTPRPTPDPTGRPSSVRRAPPEPVLPAPPPDEDDSQSVPIASLPGGETDETPTIISSAAPARPDMQVGRKLEGRRLGHFELMHAVGVGGMAAVIRARDLDLGRDVALKILPPDMAVDPENITRFRQEARAAAKLDHENVARVYYCGEDAGLHFISFEFVEGDNLKALLDRRGPLPPGECASYMIQVAAGLAHAAARGVVHRDIKPSNIVITPQGRAKIVDMGLARNLDPQSSMDGGVTQSGVTLGTFDYISPEQALEPRQADTRSDIYSMGCTFYHLLTGSPPVPDGTAARKLHAHQHLNPLDPRELRPELPDGLVEVLGRMMAKRPADRFQSGDELADALRALGPLTPVVASVASGGPAAPAGMGVLALAAALATVVAIVAANGIGGRVDGPEPAALWPAPPTPVTAAPPDPPPVPQPAALAPVGVAAQRDAATTAELLELLRLPAAHIRLTGREYDLTASAAVFEGRELILVANYAAEPPVLRVAYGDPSAPALGTLTLRAAPGQAAATVTLRNVAVRLAAPADAPAEAAAIRASGLARLAFESCSFTAESGAAPAGLPYAAVSVDPRPAPDPGPALALTGCYFGPGAVAVRAGPSLSVEATDCAFAPHQALFRLEPGPAGASPAEVALLRCSALLEAGAVVEAIGAARGGVRAGHSLFASLVPATAAPEPTMPGVPATPRRQAVLVRRAADGPGGVTFAPVRVKGASLKNGYFRVAAALIGGRPLPAETLTDPAGAVSDPSGVLLESSPWLAAEPDAPLQADGRGFRVRADVPDLRVPRPDGDGDGLLGAELLRGQRMFESRLRPIAPPAAPVAVARGRVWHPGLPASESAPAGVFRSLSEALAGAAPGDVVRVRHQGPLAVERVELSRPDLDVTLRPDDGYRPVLVAAVSQPARASMFRLYAGKIAFEDLQFDVRPVRPDMETSRAVVAMLGGEAAFRGCVVTLGESDAVRLSLVALPDPEDDARPGDPATWPVPRVKLERTWLRGRGDLLSVQRSRPFDLELSNALAALDGTLVRVEPSQRVFPAGAAGSVRLDRVTAALTGPLAWVQALPSLTRGPMNHLGVVPLRVSATGCLFAPAASPPAALVRFDRVEGDAVFRDRELLSWRGSARNLYGFTTQPSLVQLTPEGPDAMPPKPYDVDRWLALTGEPGRPFAGVKFRAPLPERGQFALARPDDFRVASVTPPMAQLGLDPARLGADLERLPRLYEDRADGAE